MLLTYFKILMDYRNGWLDGWMINIQEALVAPRRSVVRHNIFLSKLQVVGCFICGMMSTCMWDRDIFP